MIVCNVYLSPTFDRQVTTTTTTNTTTTTVVPSKKKSWKHSNTLPYSIYRQLHVANRHRAILLPSL
jgi:hypothetical protein